MSDLLRNSFAILLALSASTAWSTDACSPRSIQTKAAVSVSDGTHFLTESWYHSRDAAAIRHLNDTESLAVVEGPLSWASEENGAQLGSSFVAHFALGHQFHAILLDFDAIVNGPVGETTVTIRGERYAAVRGEHPHGGFLSLLVGDDRDRPVGLAFEMPEAEPILVTFHDWRGSPNELPYHVQIGDGERVFDYHYSDVRVSEQSPLWFFEAIPAPLIDEVQVYRLHRQLLAAHCLGDASLMAELSAPTTVVASRGDIVEPTRQSTQDRFDSVFERVNYTSYTDLVSPILRIAESGDIGWIAVNVRARGEFLESGEAFDDQWAWIMVVEKMDGLWRHAGNASNHRN